MTTNDRFERGLAGWLREDAAFRVPDHLDEVLSVTRETHQRSAWSSLERWLPVDTTFRPRLFNMPKPSQILVVAAIVLALVGALLLYAGSQQRHLPPPFGLARTGAQLSWTGGDIDVAQSDGSASKHLIGGPTDDLAPIPTRDGTHLMFLRSVTVHTTLLMMARIDGSEIHQVLPAPLVDADWFEWSPDDQRLAVVNTVGDHRALTIVDVAKGTSRDLDLGDLSAENDVFWLPPAGARLVFTAQPTRQDVPQVKAIYTIRSDGTGLQNVTPLRTELAVYNDIDVSHDGRYVSYWNWEPDPLAGENRPHIHLLDLTTGHEERITFDPTAAGETALRFSPDGEHVVIQREDTQGQLLIGTLDRTGPTRLVGPRFDLDTDPNYGFTPDGNDVFFALPWDRPYLFDVSTGAGRRGPTSIENFAGYQRLGS